MFVRYLWVLLMGFDLVVWYVVLFMLVGFCFVYFRWCVLYVGSGCLLMLGCFLVGLIWLV